MCRAEEKFTDKIVPLGVDRPEALSVYEYSGTTPQNVGPFAQHIPDILYQNQDALIQNVNYWLKEIGINFEIKLKIDKSSDVFQIKIIDKDRTWGKVLKNKPKNVEINFKDAGTGVKSILPIILNSVLTNGSILTIQEPERSMHPKYQIKLADMFIQMSKRRGNSFIIETHSEYLVYRFMKLVRDGIISNEKLSFNYVVKTPNGSEIKHLRMDEKGSFIDKWPEGFFTERFEVFK